MVKSLLLTILLAISLSSCEEIPNENQAQTIEKDQAYEKAKVLYAADGDTIWVDIDGKE